jgi:uncharacterized membrane protein YgcG
VDDRPPSPPGDSPQPTQPLGSTSPIRPAQTGTEPIPDRVRQPIVVPHQESTIAGLPRALVVAGIVGLAAAVLVGFMIGRSLGGEETAEAPQPGRRAACERALTLALQVSALQDQAIANRTEALQALVLEDEGTVRELAGGLSAITAATEETRAQLTPAAERCRSGGGGGGRRRGGNGREGGGGNG